MRTFYEFPGSVPVIPHTGWNHGLGPDPRHDTWTLDVTIMPRCTVRSSNQSVDSERDMHYTTLHHRHYGATTQPCLTPLNTGNHFESYPSTGTQLNVSVLSALNKLIISAVLYACTKFEADSSFSKVIRVSQNLKN